MRIKFVSVILTSIVLLNISLSQKRALLIGVNMYESPEYSGRPLNAIKGQQLLKSILLDQGFEESNIDAISGKQATYEGIKVAFQQFEDKIKGGDIGVIHYYGHGTQIEDDNNDEIDRLDEAFIPYDGFAKSSKDFKKLIRDDELGIWVDNIRRKVGSKGQVLVILDACHSGSGLRSETEKRNVSEKCNLGTPSPTLDMAPLVVFYSSMPHQSSFELRVDGNERCALLTWAFCKTFLGLNTKMTYRNLFDLVTLNMAMRSRKQTPLIEGNIDHEIFGNKIFPYQDYHKVIACTGKKKILISAGLLKSLQAGSRVAIYDLNVHDTSGSIPLTYGTVSESLLSFTESVIELDEYIADSCLIHSKVFLVEQRFSQETMSIRVDICNSGLKEKLITGLLSINPLKISEDEKVDLILSDKKGKLILWSAEMGNLWEKKYNVEKQDQIVDLLRNELAKFLQARFLRNLEIKNTHYLIHCEVESRERFFHKNDSNAILTIRKEKEIAELRITNNSKIPVYYTVIDIDPKNEVNVLIPGRGRLAEEYRLGPNELSPIHRVKFNVSGQEVLKVIATPVPVDLRNVVTTRGKSSRNNGFFESLLASNLIILENQQRGSKQNTYKGNEAGMSTLVINVID